MQISTGREIHMPAYTRLRMSSGIQRVSGEIQRGRSEADWLSMTRSTIPSRRTASHGPDLLCGPPHRTRSLAAIGQFSVWPFNANGDESRNGSESVRLDRAWYTRATLRQSDPAAARNLRIVRGEPAGRDSRPHGPRNRGQSVSSFFSSPDSYISRTISAPPTNWPLT